MRRSESGARRKVFKEWGGEVLGEDAVVGDEFQSLVELLGFSIYVFNGQITHIGVRRVFGLDEDRALARWRPNNTTLGHGLLVWSYRRSATSL